MSPDHLSRRVDRPSSAPPGHGRPHARGGPAEPRARTAALVLLLLAIGVAGCGGGDGAATAQADAAVGGPAAHPSPESLPAQPAATAPEAPPTPANEPPDEPGEEGVRTLLAGIWWNQEAPREQLSLGEEQRRAMDAAFAGILREHRRRLAAQRDSRRSFEEALRAGRDEEARGHLADLEEAAAAAGVLQPRLRLAVLSLLTPEQRQALASGFPEVLELPWVRGVGGEGRRRGRRQSAGQGP